MHNVSLLLGSFSEGKIASVHRIRKRFYGLMKFVLGMFFSSVGIRVRAGLLYLCCPFFVPLKMITIRTAITLLRKEIAVEMRTRYAVNTMVAFTGSSLLLVLFSLRADQMEPGPRSGLIWIILLFAALSGMARSFVQEKERKTDRLLQLHARGTDVFVGKFMYNALFLFVILVPAFVIYVLIMGMSVAAPLFLLSGLMFGATGLASVTTLTSAMVAQASRKGSLFAILSIPLLTPLLLILINITKTGLVHGVQGDSYNDLTALIAYSGVTITMGWLLFDLMWGEG